MQTEEFTNVIKCYFSYVKYQDLEGYNKSSIKIEDLKDISKIERIRKSPANKKGISVLPAHLQSNFIGPDPFASPRTKASLHLPHSSSTSPEPVSPAAVPQKKTKTKSPVLFTSGYNFKSGDIVPALFLPGR